ncbi:TRAP transporter large permease [Brevibacterium album]|uniref:TRAP transporter large permease n=1 Tax=Brevibacterium album TaxID=417948 RepID=UPI0004086260|nr:TRAP transporter large permease subunit [Brevibacterium album]
MTLLIDLLPAGMFLALFVLLALGVPVAFSLFGVAAGFCLLAWGTSGMPLIVSGVFGSINNFTLVAIPLFILMSVLLEKSKIVEELFDVLYRISWKLRGGLAIAAIVVGAILGAISGVVAAGVIGLGLIALPQMLKYRYRRGIALGAVMAGGTLGQLIPPSLNMVVFGAITGVSVASLFAGGLSAGILLAALYVVFIVVLGILRPGTFPKPEGAPTSGEQEAKPHVSPGRVLRGLILPGVLITVVLGTILSGTATPTEGAVIGVIGTLALAALSGGLDWRTLRDTCWSATKTTGMIVWILAGAAAFSAVFAGVGGQALMIQTAEMAPGGRWGVLIFAVLFLFVLGMFLETMAVILLAAPILTPIIIAQGFDSLWWALLFMVLLQTAYLTPPFGFAIFYLKSITAKAITIGHIYRATLPFIGLQILFVVLCVVFPGLLTWFPGLLE